MGFTSYALLPGLLAGLGCAPSPARAPASPVGAPASPPVDRQQCVIRGDHVRLERVVVHLKDTEEFDVDVKDATVAMTLPTEAGGPVGLVVDGAFSFTASRANAWLAIISDLSTAGGMVTLRRGSRLVDVTADGDMVVGSAVMDADDVLEGEDKDPDEVVTPVRVPCRLLVAGGVEADDRQADEDYPPSDVWWKPKGPESEAAAVQLRASRSTDAPSVLYRTPHCLGPSCISLEQIEDADDWLLVGRSGSGVTVTGWVPRSQIEKLPPGDGAWRSYGCHGHHGRGFRGRSKTPAGWYEGPAAVRAGTRVFADPPEGEWAVFTRDTPVMVSYDRKEEWVWLYQVPGLGEWVPAFVPVERVTFPPSVSQPVGAPQP